jgi:hypothetical protein
MQIKKRLKKLLLRNLLMMRYIILLAQWQFFSITAKTILKLLVTILTTLLSIRKLPYPLFKINEEVPSKLSIVLYV